MSSPDFSNISFDLPKNQSNVIKVIGVGGGGSNAMGAYYHFLEQENVNLVGVEAAGEGLRTNKTAATIALGKPGVLHASHSYLIQDEDGQIVEPHSISAGLDYPGIGPEHAYLHDIGRAEYLSATDDEALHWFQECARLEGILPALEPSHAIPRTVEIEKKLAKTVSS